MRLAVLSDIHGNLEAFQEVLKDLDALRPDRVVCLGDAVGYGPDPDAVLELIIRRRIPCVMGNHELGLIDPRTLSWFNASARRSLEITRTLLPPERFDEIRSWKRALRQDGALFVHGCPPDNVFRYLIEFTEDELPHLFDQFEEDLCFVGHTHLLELVSWNGKTLRVTQLAFGKTRLEEGYRHIVNVGSVGQPRDGTNSAKYVIWDRERQALEVRGVPYDIRTTAEKILRIGLPSINALRLW